MNSEAKAEKCSDLANWGREAMLIRLIVMKMLSLSRASKPLNASTKLGILRSQALARRGHWPVCEQPEMYKYQPGRAVDNAQPMGSLTIEGQA
jgi:hypothetical protein